MTQGVFNIATASEEEMQARISLLASEMDANDEENREHQEEINAIYAKIDSLKK